MSSLLVRGGRVLDAQAKHFITADLRLRDAVVRDPKGDVLPQDVDAAGCLVVPAFTDLTATLRCPQDPDTQTPDELRAAARRGGFTTVICAPTSGPGQVPAGFSTDERAAAFQHLLASAAPSEIRLDAAPAPLGAAELGEIWSMVRGRGATVLRLLESTDDALLLRRALECARAADAVVMLPSVDARLSHKAVLVESAVSTRLGLSAVPEASEAIGVCRILELAALTGARVHIAHIFTARGIALVEQAQRDGLRVSACVAALHLLLDERSHLARPYDTALRIWPPLPTQNAREALIDAVIRGTLCVSSGHGPAPKRERDLEMALATPGVATLELLLPALLPILGEQALVEALAMRPAAVLRRPTSLTTGARQDLLVIDPKPTTTFMDGPLRGLAGNGRIRALITGGIVEEHQLETAQ